LNQVTLSVARRPKQGTVELRLRPLELRSLPATRACCVRLLRAPASSLLTMHQRLQSGLYCDACGAAAGEPAAAVVVRRVALSLFAMSKL
jgi:hypothetical protein